jgi:hypothetical protein
MTLRRSALPRPGRLVPVPRRHGDRDDGKEERDPKPFLSFDADARRNQHQKARLF